MISIQVARRLPFLRQPLLLLVPAFSLGIITADDDEANRASSTYTFKLLYKLSGDSRNNKLQQHQQQETPVHLADVLNVKTLWGKAKKRVDAFAYRQFEGAGSTGQGRGRATGGQGASGTSSSSSSSGDKMMAVISGPAAGRWLLVTPCCQALVALKALQRAKQQQQEGALQAQQQQQQQRGTGEVAGVLSASAVLGPDVGWSMEQVKHVLGVEVVVA